MTLILTKDDRFQIDTVGRKAFNLGLMKKNGLPSLEGIVLIPPIDEKEMQKAWDYFKEPKSLAVRSSMLNEDGLESSMAGKFETVLGVKTYKSFQSAIQKVLNSNNNSTNSSILIQNMFNSDISGVLFTRTEPKSSTLYIEATYGLGETLVGGMVTPDQYWIEHDTMKAESIVSEKKIYGIFLEETPLQIGDWSVRSFGKTRKIAPMGKGKFLGSIPYTERKQPSLSEDQLQKLVEFALRIETIFGSPQDIEWAINGNEIMILQSRPITSFLVQNQPANIRSCDADDVFLTGITASTGVVEGVVRTHFKEGELVNEPFIYVGLETKPELLYSLDNLIGIVTEYGGLLCHASIVARELRIPCMVNVSGATEQLMQGDKIILNATEGYIERSE